MKNVFFLNKYRMVDLSKRLYPEKEDRRLAIRKYIAEPINDFHSEIDLMNHLGTHVEAPLHFNEDWKNILKISLDSYIGRAVLLELNNLEPRAPVTPKELESADCGRVKSGDLIQLNSPYYLEPFTCNSNTDKDKRPYVCKETAEWLVSKGIKAVGFGDTVSIERSKKDVVNFMIF